MRGLRLALAVIASGIAIPAAAPAQTYTVDDLGPTGSGTSSARRINASGELVGWASATLTGTRQAFFWSAASGMVPIGSLGGASFAVDLDPSGSHVVGESLLANSVYKHAFLFTFTSGTAGTMLDLGTLGGNNSSARAINAAGKIAGWSELSSLDEHAFLYAGGTMMDLGTTGGAMSHAWAINAADQIAGESDTADGHTYAVVWSSDRATALGALPGGRNSSAQDINEAGHVVGWSNIASGARHAFLYRGGAMLDLASAALQGNAIARGVNAFDAVVGQVTVKSGDNHAFLYTPDAGMIDLNDVLSHGSPWVLQAANDIADDGTIAGVGFLNGIQRAFRMVPTPPPTTTTVTTTSTTLVSTTTSTTRPPPPDCVVGAPGACDDGDPCTTDTCTVGGCQHERRTGIDAVTCVFERGTPPYACTPADLDPRTRRRLGRARRLIEQAAANPRRARRLVQKGLANLESVRALLAKAHRTPSPACRTALTALVDAAQQSAAYWLSQ